MHCLECPRLGRLPPLTEGTTEQMQGMPVCLEDRARIGDHLNQQVCPLGHFGTVGKLEANHNEAVLPWNPKVPLAGDIVAGVIEKFGIDRVAKLLAHLAGFKDCGCEKRRRWMNNLDRRLRRKLGIDR
jgi:hypothetical protein